MATQIVLLFLIAALIAYVIYLKVQITRKNLLIESTIQRISGMEKNLGPEEMNSFIREIRRAGMFAAYSEDKLLEKDTTDFIFENIGKMKIYMHYTRNEEDARRILADGFKFADSFHRTALPVTKDNLDLRIKHNDRKLFGDFLLVICISSDIVSFYSSKLESAGIKNFLFENILTVSPPVKNENSDLIYHLPPQYLKGYINYHTGKIIKNPAFNPGYDSIVFLKNIELLKASNQRP